MLHVPRKVQEMSLNKVGFQKLVTKNGEWKIFNQKVVSDGNIKYNGCRGWGYPTKLTFNVAPFGPISLCLLFTNLSLLRTSDPIFIMSQATSSSSTR